VLEGQIDEISLRGRHGNIKPVCYDLDRRKQRARACELSSITQCNLPVRFDKALSYRRPVPGLSCRKMGLNLAAAGTGVSK
jgi:hypothetical protein